jgi:VanZ family protein
VSPAARFLRYELPALLWAAGIFTLSSLSRLPGPPLVDGLDKVGHFSAYLVLGLLTARALGARGLRSQSAALLGLLLATLYGVSDEWHQHFVPGRSVDALDLLADTLGACVGVALWRSRQPALAEPRPEVRH